MLKKIKGFTLIEVIIVISILGIMVIAIIPSYRAYNKRNQLRESAQLVRSAIVEAQNNALAPKPPPNTDSDWRYGAKYKDSRTFVVYQTNPNVTGSDEELRTYNLASPVEWVTSNWDVQFTSPNATAELPCSTTLSIKLKLIGKSDSNTINLNCISGQINIVP